MIDSSNNVTIVHSHFILQDIGKEIEPNHVIKVYNTEILFVYHTHVGNKLMQHSQNYTYNSETKSSTNLGIKLDNVTFAELRSIAKHGVIFGDNSVNITTINSSFLSNQASKSGAVFYLINSCSLTNHNSVFRNNSARKHAGVVYAMHDVIINNTGCLFHNNFAETGNGSVIWMQYNCQLTNRQVSSLISLGMHEKGGLIRP